MNVTAGSNPVRTVRIQFGDGSAQSLGALGDGATTVSHIYQRAGTFLVTLTATDGSGERTTISTPVVVAARAPLSVEFDSTPAVTGGPPVSVAFAVTVSPSDVPIRRYDWSFGDGRSLSTSGPSTSHVYRSDGTRTVRVTAVAVDGRTATAQIQIVIPEETPLNVTLTATPATPTAAPITVSFIAVITQGAAIDHFEWSFGDGTSAETSGGGTSHIYTVPGTVVVTVTAVAVDGRRGTGRIELIIP